MKKYLFIVLLIGNFGCSPPPVKMEYVSFGDYEYDQTSLEKIFIYEDRLKIDSKFEEIGVVILSSSFENSYLKEIKIIASKKGANGIIIEGKNAVLLRVEKIIIKEEADSESSI